MIYSNSNLPIRCTWGSIPILSNTPLTNVAEALNPLKLILPSGGT